jgi:hypothetical protein
MPYPTLKPSSRNFDAGDYPIKSFRSQSGAETRILYGNRRTGATASLTYENITDTNANSFVTHFDETKGTYLTFNLPTEAVAGWSPGTLNIGTGNAWRYAEAPSITSVKNGYSTVQIKLIAVL